MSRWRTTKQKQDIKKNACPGGNVCRRCLSAIDVNYEYNFAGSRREENASRDDLQLNVPTSCNDLWPSLSCVVTTILIVVVSLCPTRNDFRLIMVSLIGKIKRRICK